MKDVTKELFRNKQLSEEELKEIPPIIISHLEKYKYDSVNLPKALGKGTKANPLKIHQNFYEFFNKLYSDISTFKRTFNSYDYRRSKKYTEA